MPAKRGAAPNEALGTREEAELRRQRTAKLLPEHAGPVARYLAEPPGCTVAQTLALLREVLVIDSDREALRR